MSIKRFVANSDTTITNAYEPNLIRRAQYANMGAADSLEMFSIFGQVLPTTVEKSRILVKFPVEDMASARLSGTLPQSGSVSFFVRLSNVTHPYSLPSNYDLLIKPVSGSWVEGIGLDMEDYSDLGVSGSTGSGCNWLYRDIQTQWVTGGGDFLDQYSVTYHIDNGQEDIFADVTRIVEAQMSSVIPNYGLGIMLSGAYENNTGSISYYTKKFSARNSQFFYKRPYIEARWDGSVKDDRNDFYASSSLLDESDNKYNLYFYNRVKGNYKNIPSNPFVTVKFYTDTNRTQEVAASYLSMSNPATGKYKAVVAINTTASALYDYWMNSVNTGTVYFSSSFDVKNFAAYEDASDLNYNFKVVNLKNSYKNNEVAKLKIFSRKKDWSPTIYTVANTQIETSIHKNLYYKIFRYSDNYTIIDYSTGSLKYSLVSYDSSGNYFDLDMSLYEPDYSYAIKFAFLEDNQLRENNEIFKFRVETA
jgi:hypothetical protein